MNRTSRRLKHADFSIFETAIESAHELQLNVIRGEGMMEILDLHDDGRNGS